MKMKRKKTIFIIQIILALLYLDFINSSLNKKYIIKKINSVMDLRILEMDNMLTYPDIEFPTTTTTTTSTDSDTTTTTSTDSDTTTTTSTDSDTTTTTSTDSDTTTTTSTDSDTTTTTSTVSDTTTTISTDSDTTTATSTDSDTTTTTSTESDITTTTSTESDITTTTSTDSDTTTATSTDSDTTTTIPGTTTIPINGTSTTTSGNSSIIFQPKSSSSGLSAGAICAIAIPCGVALLGAIAAAFLCKGGAATPPVPQIVAPSIPPPNFIETSLDKINVIPEIPPQQPMPVQMIQPEPVQIIQPEPVQMIQPQPVQQIIRPSYPLQKAEPPVVNRAFQPMYFKHPIVAQQTKMVPVQQIEMVPTQKVEMVPVHEVIPIQQAAAVQQFRNVQQVAPIQQITTINQAGKIGLDSGIINTSEIMPEVRTLGQKGFSQAQNFQGGMKEVGYGTSNL